MSPKRAYVMYCAAILQSNERIKEITMRCKNHIPKPKPKPKPIQIKNFKKIKLTDNYVELEDGGRPV